MPSKTNIIHKHQYFRQAQTYNQIHYSLFYPIAMAADNKLRPKFWDFEAISTFVGLQWFFWHFYLRYHLFISTFEWASQSLIYPVISRDQVKQVMQLIQLIQVKQLMQLMQVMQEMQLMPVMQVMQLMQAVKLVS